MQKRMKNKPEKDYGTQYATADLEKPDSVHFLPLNTRWLMILCFDTSIIFFFCHRNPVNMELHNTKHFSYSYTGIKPLYLCRKFPAVIAMIMVETRERRIFF